MSSEPGFTFYLALLFAGALLCNCIPHLAAGLRGELFPTPFATPRGVGNSSPWVNTLWGFFNLLLGIYLLNGHSISAGLNPGCATLAVGALVMGLYLSWHFGNVQRNRRAV
ncbi:hypothetical protein [Pseudomonas sp. NA-150]|uniref:hypothetical protein n=1 Tax=Pseudomonas sp. NA-150 TaxID=3367525 RepID=UPI0037C6FCBE